MQVSHLQAGKLDDIVFEQLLHSGKIKALITFTFFI